MALEQSSRRTGGTVCLKTKIIEYQESNEILGSQHLVFDNVPNRLSFTHNRVDKTIFPLSFDCKEKIASFRTTKS